MDVVAPQTQPIVVSTGKGDYRRDDRNGLEWLSLANQIAQGHIQNQIHNVGEQVGANGIAIGEAAAATQRHLGDIGHRNGVAIGETASVTQREVGRSAQSLLKELCDVRENVGRVGSDVKAEVTAGQRQAAESLGSTQRQAADLARELAMQEERNSARLTLELEKRTNDIEVQAERNAAAVALAQATNTAALQAKFAECCCELRAEAAQTRELVREKACETQALVLKEHNQTRELMRDVEQRKLRDDLETANRKLLALEFRQSHGHGRD